MGSKVYDLGKKMDEVKEAPSDEKWYSSLDITKKEIPEIEDYELGDEIEFVIIATVVSESKREGESKNLTLEMRKGKIINTKEIRERSYEMGLSLKDTKEVLSKKK